MSGSLFSLKSAALPVSVSALLHIFVFVPDGLNARAAMMLAIGLVYILMAIGLRRNLRWVAWLTFLAMTFGAVAAYIVFWWHNAAQRMVSHHCAYRSRGSNTAIRLFVAI